MKILLIRHGETTGDIEDKYGGAYDDHLTDLGREQLEITAKKLVGTNIDIMFSSTLIRARESVEIINNTVGTKIEFVEGLRERNYGILGGLTKTEALEKYPEAVESHKDPSNTDPDGEAQLDFIARVVGAFELIIATQHECIVILAHGGSLKVILNHLNLPLPDSIGDGEIIEVSI